MFLQLPDQIVQTVDAALFEMDAVEQLFAMDRQQLQLLTALAVQKLFHRSLVAAGISEVLDDGLFTGFANHRVIAS